MQQSPRHASSQAAAAATLPTCSAAGGTGPEPLPDESEVLELLEGLLEGFREAAGAPEPGYEAPAPPGAAWSELDTLDPLREYPRPQRAVSQVPVDSVSTLMRRHALRAFLEETCGTVANAFDVLAGLALRATLGGTGGAQDRLRHMFTEQELCSALAGLGYGVGAASSWWHEVFSVLDMDGDGLVSLQDMYDALVLQLPPMPDEEDKPQVFFSNPPEERWQQRAGFPSNE